MTSSSTRGRLNRAVLVLVLVFVLVLVLRLFRRYKLHIYSRRHHCLYNFDTFTSFPCPFSVLAIALFIYYTSVPAGTEARTKEVK